MMGRDGRVIGEGWEEGLHGSLCISRGKRWGSCR